MAVKRLQGVDNLFWMIRLGLERKKDLHRLLGEFRCPRTSQGFADRPDVVFLGCGPAVEQGKHFLSLASLGQRDQRLDQCRPHLGVTVEFKRSDARQSLLWLNWEQRDGEGLQAGGRCAQPLGDQRRDFFLAVCAGGTQSKLQSQSYILAGVCAWFLCNCSMVSLSPCR